MFKSLMQNRHDLILEEGLLEDADLIYGGERDMRTRRRITKKADQEDLNIKSLGFNDLTGLEEDEIDELGAKINGKKFLYRHKNFLNNRNRTELDKLIRSLFNNEKPHIDDEDPVLEAFNNLYRLQNEHDLQLLNDPLLSALHDQKDLTVDLLEHQLSRLDNARTVEQYNPNEAYEIAKDRVLVGKPVDGSGGDGVTKLHSEDEIDRFLDEYEDGVIEEYIPHDTKDEYEDRRAYIAGGSVVATTTRQNNEQLATNLAKGGQYVDGSELDDIEAKAVSRAAEGLDFTAIDYVKTPEEVIIYENNPTCGTDYHESSGELIDDVLASIESDHGSPHPETKSVSAAEV